MLLADIGGTNARFALADPRAGLPLLEDGIQTFPVDQFPSLAAAAQAYLASNGARPEAAVLAGVYE